METAPSGLSYASITQYAEEVGSHYGIYSDEGRADISQLMRILGGQTKIAHDDKSMHVARQGEFTVYIPRLTSARRDRFTIAHELGHYFLHYVYAGHQGEVRFNRGATNRAETEANFFAAALLMPTEPFKREWNRTLGDARELARLFDVSPRATEVRAQVLSLNRG